MAGKRGSNGNGGQKPKQVTRYTYDEVKEPRTPETGHTALMPGDEQVVTLPMDTGWSKALKVGRLPEGDQRPVVVDMDPAVDPVLFWSGKRDKRDVPVLPLQRNEIVSESRIAQIIERAQKAVADKDPATRQGHLFADLEKTLRETDKKRRVEFYTHDENWKNKLICGDSLPVMESLLHYEGLRGKVQTIYMDPPYGIKYDSNFQQRIDSTKNVESDQADDVLTIKAFRDTWALGVHSYLSYLAERLYFCRDLLTDSGSIFVQISDDNIHHVRELLDEVFGADNACGLIAFRKTSSANSPVARVNVIASVADYLLWYAKDRNNAKYRQLYLEKVVGGEGGAQYTWIERAGEEPRPMRAEEIENIEELLRTPGARLLRPSDLSSTGFSESLSKPFVFGNRSYDPPANSHWKTTVAGLERLAEAGRIIPIGKRIYYKRYFDDFPLFPLTNIWLDTGNSGFADPKVYSVQTNARVISRCILITSDPGDLVFDPTCGSGTTAFCAEQWGRRWVTCDTSRVALNVARQRILSGVFDHYRTKGGAVASGFVSRAVPHRTLKSIARNLEPDTVELVDQPTVDRLAIRVSGPFEVMSLGRYSIDDWKGFVAREGEVTFGQPAKLENYIGVISRLYRRDAAIEAASGLVHAVAEDQNGRIAISIGPLSGRVTARQITEAVQDALSSGLLEVHVLGWAFEANVGEIKSQLEKRGKVKVELVMIRPDTLSEGLKATQPDMLFSPLALPDLDVKIAKGGVKGGDEVVIRLKGVAVFDRKKRATAFYDADKGYVSAWYLDEDYDGDCFVDCQMFFDFKKAPNLKAALRTDVDPVEYKLDLESRPFPVRGYKRIAVKVVDVYGNESTIVRELA